MSSYKIVRSRKALREIDEIWFHLAKHHLSIARLRGYSIPPCIFIYRVNKRRRIVELLRVVDDRRDVAALIDI